jgi:hypothetical protein
MENISPKVNHVIKLFKMKNYIYCLFSLLIISCASRSIENEVINDFIKEQADSRNYFNIVVEEAPSRLLPLEYYEKAYQDRNIDLATHSVRIKPNGYPPYIWPIDTLEIKILKEKYKNDTIPYYWKKKDFVRKNFAGKDFKLLKTNERIVPNTADFRKYAAGAGFIVSKPIVSNNKYALFYYSSYTVGGSTGESPKAILMEKVDGKWKIIKTYYDPNVIS